VRSAVEIVKELRKGVVAIFSYPNLERLGVDELSTVLGSHGIMGSAFAISSDKFLTCSHVVKDRENLILIGSPGRETGLSPIHHEVVDMRQNRQMDLALLRTKRVKGEVVPIKFESTRPEVGLDILAVGYPWPEQQGRVQKDEKRIDLHVTLTLRAIRGIVAARYVDGIHFEIDKLLNPGQSGGPVVSLETGLLVGVCQAIRHWPRKDGDPMIPTDLSICLSVEIVQDVLNELGANF